MYIKRLFYVHVDTEPPKIASCPDDIYITSRKRYNKVYLPGVTVTDNVGIYLFTTSRPNGSEFTWGEHNITYKALDRAGNEVNCHFQVIITGMPMDKEFSTGICRILPRKV